jgi:hypothetical protein
VPAGTTKFTFSSTIVNPSYHVTGSLTDPNGVTHNFDWSVGSYTDPNTGYPYSEITLTNPVAGLWKLTINANATWNYLWFTGIPPLIWHDPQYLLVESP